ncbi:MAG TPA: hypothetical protein VLJ37_12150 [bacterium]|nr:hypothetical protein [bacterium]
MISRIAPFGALGAAVDLARQVAATRDASSIAGAAWVAYNGLTGIVRAPSVPSSRRFPPVSDGIRFADDPNLANDILFRAFGDEHVLYNLIGLAQTFRAMGNAMGHYAHEVGFETYLRTYMDTLSNGNRLAISEELKGAQRSVLEKVGVIYSDWVMKYAAANGWNVRFRGVEKIPPEGKRVVYAMAPHSAIYPDFFFTYADHRMVPVADLFNFRDNPSSRKFGMALIVDLIRLPLIDRRNPRNAIQCMKQIRDAAIEYNYRPGWFINGGRVPPAYEDDGTLARPGYYSNVIDIEKPRIYVQATGAVANAIDIARETDEPVTVVVVTISGAECMRKISGDFPFIQPNTIGGDIVYEVADSFQVTGDDRKRRGELGEKVDRIARENLAIDLYLREVVQQWGLKRGDVEAGRLFDQRASTDVAYRILADRIRSIRPSNHARTRFIHRLLNLVTAEAPPATSEIDAFLQEVSQAVLDAQQENLPPK